jgi:acetyl-CoA carboxylase carboxyl transferase subunit beta
VAQTINEELPEGFQRAEFLLAQGLLDAVVVRRDLRRCLARLVALLLPTARAAAGRATRPRRAAARPRRAARRRRA